MHHCDYLCEAFVQPGHWSMKALRKVSHACYQLITLRRGRKKKKKLFERSNFIPRGETVNSAAARWTD
jgi:hypothetical protein